ncbi:hypothetical protein TRICI_000922 [Trichomonascus ciferrii]|uniref:HTH APSES-type domain-containing protein n=1 Tax=Trichomonascus ciferrii TaxID=44093 RepID=A0A642VCR0_9ASCO|nr:hypothetical protein TRICI_000922 [Trichomonascus ciferrii]
MATPPPTTTTPRVTTTLWEDEGTLCFQVEAKGVCVARREDNNMVNGTKLLNVAGMTRGRRDGILKTEKERHVVKVGAMHLKGVWIPFERALAFARSAGIVDALYPLFVPDLKALLYNPSAAYLSPPGPPSASHHELDTQPQQPQPLQPQAPPQTNLPPPTPPIDTQPEATTPQQGFFQFQPSAYMYAQQPWYAPTPPSLPLPQTQLRYHHSHAPPPQAYTTLNAAPAIHGLPHADEDDRPPPPKRIRSDYT